MSSIKNDMFSCFLTDHAQHQVVQLQVNTNTYTPNFYPPAVPSDVYDGIYRYHDNPFLWWTGQVSAFVFKLSKTTYEDLLLDDYKEVFERPIVGIHVRRTDKLEQEARSHALDEYMKHVEAWFKHSSNSSEPRVFLATDDPSVIHEMKKRQKETVYHEDEFIQYSNREELQKLGAKVQRRLQYIQNPKICTTRRKLHCKIHSGCGMGCEINTLSTCMMLAYALNRTMVTSPKLTAMVLQPFSSTCRYIKGSNVTKFGKDHEQHQVVQLQVNTNSYKPNFYPPAVPSDLYDAILRYHDNPFLWWTGQISAFVLQISKTAYKNVLLDDYEEVFEKPIVGVHVRRTDKLIHEARFYPLDEYMKHVEAWFKHSSNSEPRVYLATDEPNVINEMKKRFTQFQVIYNANFTSAAKNKHRRRTAFGQLGIIHDMYMLSKCDYLVCTFSSNVCRLAFQLMNADRGNVTDRIVSLDRPWYLWGERQAVKGKRPVVKVEMPKYLDVD